MALKQAPIPAQSISTVERETGLSKDTLRIWERRYGFPAPSRDRNGERLYPAEQVEKLRVIRRLIDRGLRPGKIVKAPLRQLAARIDGIPAVDGVRAEDAGPMREVLQLLKENNVGELHQHLAFALMRLGLQRFVIEVVGPLNAMVGEAWAQGRIAIFEEHLYTEQVQHLLRQGIGTVSHTGQRPRVLLTTLPGEEHQLGLLMAHACLAVEGAQCISLGAQTPGGEIVHAARAHGVDVVALSFSAAMPAHSARAALADLRLRLDRGIELWAGGSIWQRARKRIPGVTTIASLTAIPAALSEWRAGKS
jgi:MerR family transcriptional regulator, light-induced transcriptional regulator